ncbi:MAG: hypothetical protein R2856_25425 [Caldilineaceae bacterium]
MDLQRDDVNAHLAFGRGAHYCLGALWLASKDASPCAPVHALAVLAADVTAQNSPGASASSSAGWMRCPSRREENRFWGIIMP